MDLLLLVSAGYCQVCVRARRLRESENPARATTIHEARLLYLDAHNGGVEIQAANDTDELAVLGDHDAGGSVVDHLVGASGKVNSPKSAVHPGSEQSVIFRPPGGPQSGSANLPSS
jgi:hypothetical protein